MHLGRAMTTSKTSKLLKLIMAFAIFWMVIGELITYHQKIIFHVRFYDTLNACIKPKANDDGDAFQFAPLQNHSNNTGSKAYIAAITIQQQISLIQIKRAEFEKPFLSNRKHLLLKHIALREPPLPFSLMG